MRPIRFLLSVATGITALTLILYVVFGAQSQDAVRTEVAPAKKGKFKALFSFTSPASLFPPSAIISLTDDNSTFFLARPAAFGPPLPEKGLSGPLWVGNGFGEDAMGRGELGCSDVEGSNTITKTAQEIEEGAVEGARAKRTGDIQSLQEGAEIAGKVVLLKRGGCGFLEKVQWAQTRGGVAVIVGDNVRGGALVRMYANGDTSNISIPSLFTSHTTAHLLSSLLASEGFPSHMSPDDAAKLEVLKSGKGNLSGNHNGISGNKLDSEKRPTSTRGALTSQTSKASSEAVDIPNAEAQNEGTEEAGWLTRIMHTLGFGDAHITPEDSRRPPSSGDTDWVVIENWDETHSGQKTMKPPTSTSPPDSFIIGEQDWRDPDMLPTPTMTSIHYTETARPHEHDQGKDKSVLPGSGEYNNDAKQEKKGWLSSWAGDVVDDTSVGSNPAKQSSPPSMKTGPSDTHGDEEKADPKDPEHHEGLWVTLAPTNMSSSPFFDTLLVLVVSPLVTLTVVYALLMLRSRIRRRAWRAPKSVVERLPVRTYHTISDSNSSTSSTAPGPASPTTPLLQHSRSSSSRSRPRSRTASEVPASSSSFQTGDTSTEEEKREAGLAEWRRRYGGRQKECVVCLEEYVDGVSRVMSLPCGHEFHADCITPWLVTRRRTCPICKGDVVRDMSRSRANRTHHSPTRSSRPLHQHQDPESLQSQAAESRNDHPSSSRPVPMSSSTDTDYRDDFNDDVEANWADNPLEDRESHGARDIPHAARTGGLSSSLNDLSSTVSTVIWRGVDAIRGVAGMTRQPSREEDIDRDR